MSKGYVVTNHHVIDDLNTAEFATFELNVEENKFGSPQNAYEYVLYPDRFFFCVLCRE